MNNDCAQRKDQLLEAALAQSVAPELQEHLLACANCAEELSALRARRERLDALLPFVAQEADPSPKFRARVLAAAHHAGRPSRTTPWPLWAVTGIATAALAALLLSFLPRWRSTPSVPEPELAAAPRLTEWRAPSDVFLETPGRDFLRATPKLGDSYLPIHAIAKEKRP
jgi:hypothetical protein